MPKRSIVIPVSSSGFSRRVFCHGVLGGGALLAGAPYGFARSAPPGHARGVVFHDAEGDGQRRAGARGLEGVAVSNGRRVTLTDERGRWSLPVEDDEQTTFFVIKPRGWMTPLSSQNLPRFHYIHQPGGSPPQRFGGVAPTGPLPDSIDFPLAPREEPDRFTVLMCGDPQPRNAREVEYLARTVVPALRGSRAAFGVSLGDIVSDNLSLFEPLNEVFALIGKRWHNVLGNHDLNFDAADNRHANETFRSVYGPTYYAFDYGPVHFIVLNNVQWLGQDPDQPRSGRYYRGHLGERQLQFVQADLAQVPEDRLVVLMMHIPLEPIDRVANPVPQSFTSDRRELYRLLESRPHTLSFAAHRHRHAHVLAGSEQGWGGSRPHHHVIAGTLCGSWFRGAPDERGIPHATMTDGTPRGYMEVQFDGHQYNIDGYRVLQRPADYQMHVEAPSSVDRRDLGGAVVHVNVFNGSEHSQVRMKVGGGTWILMQRIEEPDPAYVQLFERDGELAPPYRELPRPSPCLHLWRAALPDDLAAGTHLIEVAAEDMFGNRHRGVRPVRIAG